MYTSCTFIEKSLLFLFPHKYTPMILISLHIAPWTFQKSYIFSCVAPFWAILAPTSSWQHVESICDVSKNPSNQLLPKFTMMPMNILDPSLPVFIKSFNLLFGVWLEFICSYLSLFSVMLVLRVVEKWRPEENLKDLSFKNKRKDPSLDKNWRHAWI